ncbi:MAG: ABC transporter substrate-binding protein [Acidimicrobiia bacterium]
MQDRTLRTIGASAVLAGIAIAGVFQIGSRVDASPADIIATDTDHTVAVETQQPDTLPSTTVPEPFVYRLGVLSGVSTDNFWAYYSEQPSVWNSYILGPTKPALFTLDPGTGTLEPELIRGDATPTWDGNGWRVRLELTEGLSWSDGEPVTAHDLAFTFDTVRKLELGGSWADAYPEGIESINADGDYSLRIEFEKRPDLSVWPHGVGLAPVMPEHAWADLVAGKTAKDLYAMSGASDVSGGPLALASTSDTLIVSTANPGYPGETPDIVEYHVYETEADLVAALGADEIDSLLTPKGVTKEQLGTLETDDSVAVITNPANGIRYLGFNLTREPMSNIAFRSALALLLDREELAETISQSGQAAWSMVPAANGQWFDPDADAENRDRYAGDLGGRLEKAVADLTAAGYAWTKPPALGADGALVAGEGLTIGGRPPQPLTILTPGDEYDTARPVYVQHIADTLAILGFDTRPVETDFDTVVDLAFTKGDDGELHYDMYLLGWTLGSPAHPQFYRPLFATGGEMNNTGYTSKTFDKALAAYESAFTSEAALDALWKMEQTLSVDLPYLPLFTSQLTEVYRSDRVAFGVEESLGGLQGRLGGIGDVRQIDR